MKIEYRSGHRNVTAYAQRLYDGTWQSCISVEELGASPPVETKTFVLPERRDSERLASNAALTWARARFP